MKILALLCLAYAMNANSRGGKEWERGARAVLIALLPCLPVACASVTIVPCAYTQAICLSYRGLTMSLLVTRS